MKFTSEGEIELRISLCEEEEDAVVLLFKVRDTGIGIPREKMDKLFKGFSQVDSSTTRKFGGTGLGLTISKNLTKLMKGEIGVESEFGRGSTFWFTAKFRKQDKISPYAEFRESFSDEKVLIVDDNSTAREILSLYLSELGCTVVEASDGREALDLIKTFSETEEPFNSCIVDQIMPGMDGWYLASEVNSLKDQTDNENLKNLKLYLVSPAGRSAEEAKMKLLNWFSGYLNKPLRKEQLFSVFAGMSKQDTEGEEPAELLPVDEDVDTSRIVALVAEDHEVNQQLFKSILQNLGCEVVLAANGLEAVERAEDSHPDIIFMDCQMPEMNGYEASAEIRKRGLNTPIIAVTASAVKGEREKCFDSGMSDFLTKPFKKKDIQPVLQKWRGMKHNTGHAQLDPAGPEPADLLPAEPEEIFDYKDAVETFLGNEETVKRLIGDYITKVAGQISQIETALESKDIESARELAHSIKGSALNLSMLSLGEAAKELEYSSRDGELEQSVKNLEKVTSEYLRLKKFVEERL
jgi:CheY-like chemotaxis protein/HPt (histidine-containing phosphotransfer) domain-containing protein